MIYLMEQSWWLVWTPGPKEKECAILISKTSWEESRFTSSQHLILRREYRTSRGMSLMHDWKDWLGGYPFEVAKPEEIFEFCRSRGFSLEKLTTCSGRFGCNEFVFEKSS